MLQKMNLLKVPAKTESSFTLDAKKYSSLFLGGDNSKLAEQKDSDLKEIGEKLKQLNSSVEKLKEEASKVTATTKNI